MEDIERYSDYNEIDEAPGGNKAEDIVKAKKRLCFEVTKFVRGEEDAIKAEQMSENLFAQGGNDAPEFAVEKAALANGISSSTLFINQSRSDFT